MFGYWFFYTVLSLSYPTMMSCKVFLNNSLMTLAAIYVIRNFFPKDYVKLSYARPMYLMLIPYLCKNDDSY